jgi:DNA-binding CsgD family transcriptional regulator
MTEELIGRGEELARVRSFLDSISGGPAALVLEGEAGVGKTNLWLTAVSEAESLKYRVLRAQPVEVETTFSFAALSDLLDPCLDDVLAGLPEPQRHALEAAFLLEEVTARPLDQRAVALAFTSALRLLTTGGPLLLAVDDVQWLDAPSTGVLSFAIRRLHQLPVGLVLTRRTPGSASLPLGIARALPAERLHKLSLGPLSLGALHRLVHRRLALALPRPALVQLHAASGGNPFFALEIGRALQREGRSVSPGEPLPVPRTLEELVSDRVAVLPSETRRTLLAVAAVADPTLAVLDAFDSRGRSYLRPATDAGVAAVEDGRVRFVHPLLASSIYANADPLVRRQIHRRLADVIDNIEERARHLSLAADEPDEHVARALDEAAVRARARGAPGAAAELEERALRLSPSDRMEDTVRRQIEAGSHWFEAGDADRARRHLEKAADEAGAGGLRAQVLVRLARTHAFGANLSVAARLYREALAEAEVEADVRAQAEEGLAVALMRMLKALPTAARHAGEATKIAETASDRWLLPDALGAQALIESLLGRPNAGDRMERAVELTNEDAANVPTDYFLRGLQGVTFMAGVLPIWLDDVESARTKLSAARERAHELGDESSLPLILRWASYNEWLAGNWPEALLLAEEGDELALQTGQPSQQAVLAGTRGLILAHLGHAEEARQAADQGQRQAAESSSGFGTMVAASALGFLELSRGNPAAAHEHLAPLADLVEAAGVVEPGAVRFIPDLIEALVSLRRLGDAELLLRRLEKRARKLNRASALAAGGRCRGLLHAARGEIPQAVAALERALAEHERTPMPFERARTLLALGATQRRAKQNRVARTSLNQALAVFEELGAAPWTEKARVELARIGGRRPAGHELTTTERMLAELVAEGRSNKEIAAALSLTPRTVETKLSRIYAKLAVRSRTELAHRLAQEARAIKV